MGFWNTFGRLALGFAEYALEQKYAPKDPPPVVPFPTAPSAAPPVAAPPPAPAPVAAPEPQPIDFRDPFVYSTYRLAPPEGMNRFPDDTEWRSDSENVQKYGREWLRTKMYERNGAPYPGPRVA